MTIKGKVLSVLLICFLIVTVMSAIAVSAEPAKLLDLDFSNFAASSGAPDESTERLSGISKSGSLSNSTIVSIAQRPDGENKLTKGEIENANGGKTYYIDYNDSMIYPNVATGGSYNNHLNNIHIINKAFEDEDNTIAFWIDVTPSHVWKEIMCYRIDYDGGVESFDLSVNDSGQWSATSSPSSEGPGGVTFEVNDGWNHIVITNPKRSDGQKTMDVYLNGFLVSSVILDIPDDATINNAAFMFFGKSIASEEWYRTRFSNIAAAKISELKIYRGVFDAATAENVYAAKKADFGYDFPNSIVDSTAEIAPDADSFKLTFANDVEDASNLGDGYIIDNDTNEKIKVDYQISGKTVTVIPRDYLAYDKSYTIDFPLTYCNDFVFETTSRGLKIEGTPSINADAVDISATCAESIKAKFIVIGYDDEGFVSAAGMKDVTVSGGISASVSAPGVGECSSVKLLVWEKGNGFYLPLVDTIQLR